MRKYVIGLLSYPIIGDTNTGLDVSIAIPLATKGQYVLILSQTETLNAWWPRSYHIVMARNPRLRSPL